MARRFLLGVDGGQTVAKAVLLDALGRAIALGRVDTQVAVPRPGRQERDKAATWREAATAMAACLRAGSVSGREVAAVGLCGHDDEVTDTDEAGARGAAVLAGLGLGAYATPGDAVAATVRVIREHHARPRAVLDDRFQRYLGLVHADGTGHGSETDEGPNKASIAT
jgi:sugar (pentulose or hexulose) kinase